MIPFLVIIKQNFGAFMNDISLYIYIFGISSIVLLIITFCLLLSISFIVDNKTLGNFIEATAQFTMMLFFIFFCLFLILFGAGTIFIL